MSALSKTVLLVDDEPEELSVVIQWIEGGGFKTLLAVSGAEALRLAEAHQPFLVISELKLPDMSGYELLEQLIQLSAISEFGFIVYHAEWAMEFQSPPLLNQLFQITPSGRFADCILTKPLHPRELATFTRRIYDSMGLPQST